MGTTLFSILFALAGIAGNSQTGTQPAVQPSGPKVNAPKPPGSRFFFVIPYPKAMGRATAPRHAVRRSKSPLAPTFVGPDLREYVITHSVPQNPGHETPEWSPFTTGLPIESLRPPDLRNFVMRPRARILFFGKP